MKSVLEINAETWEQDILQSNILTVVDFWHNQCPWCIKLNSVLNEIAEDYKSRIKLVKLNVFENAKNRKVAIQYGIMSTPTLLFFCKGRPVGQAVGFMPKEQLKKILDDMLARHKDCIKQSTELKD